MMLRRTLPLALTAVAVAVAAPFALADPQAGGDSGRRPATYLVGAAVESINPTDDPAEGGVHAFDKHDFFLGGYGIASGYVAPVGAQTPFQGRYATGVMGSGVRVRALAVGDGERAIELAQIETQGYFSAYKQGPFGITEIRKDAAAQIAALAATSGGAVPSAESILVDSNHSHGGPDTAGVWGGVPTAYLKFVHDQAVKALVKAWTTMRPAHLRYAVAHAGVEGESDLYPPPAEQPDALLTNQFRSDPANRNVDDEVRVLQAFPIGAPEDEADAIVTYVNYSAHPTVLGGDNTLVTADYTGVLSDRLAATYGGIGFDQVATLGRTQPARAGCSVDLGSPSANDQCALDAYAGRVARRVALALEDARWLSGPAQVALHSYLVTDPATNAPLLALSYGGYALTAPVFRAVNPPWFTGNELGAPAFSGRIGDILISGGPGEMYPQIVDKVRTEVGSDARGFLNIGTAGDFLGYIVAPVEAYPEPIRRSMFGGDPPPAGTTNCNPAGDPALPSPVGCPEPVSNDNYFFNVSHTFGERLTCALLRGAGDVLGGNPSRYWSRYDRCALFPDELAKPAGLDTQFPDQPDLSAALTH